MKLEEIKRIKQSAEEKEVNEHLAKGFQIVKIISSKVQTDGVELIQPCYVLGSTKNR